MGGLCTRLAASEDFKFKTFIPIIILIVLSAIFAGIFYAIEKDACGIDYWKALYFINTAHTTIGYGNVTPCTAGGKVLAIIYIVISVPVQLIVLDNLGKFFAAIANAIWLETYCCCCCFVSCCRKCKKEKSEENETRITKEQEIVAESNDTEKAPPKPKFRRYRKTANTALPLWIGFSLTFFWLAISALFFWLTEEGWTYWDGLYLMGVSITTVGFGDHVTARTEGYMIIIQFALILIGLSLFSLVINLIQDSIDQLKENIRQNIVQQYQDALEEERNMEEHESNDRYIDEMVRKEGWWQRYLVDKKSKKNLVRQYEMMSAMKNAVTQTPHIQYEDKNSMVKMTMIGNKSDINRPVIKLEAKSELENLRIRDKKLRRTWVDDAKWKQMKVLNSWQKGDDRGNSD